MNSEKNRPRMGSRILEYGQAFVYSCKFVDGCCRAALVRFCFLLGDRLGHAAWELPPLPFGHLPQSGGEMVAVHEYSASAMWGHE